MISFIKGTVVDFTETSAIVETPAGIGFEIYMTGSALSQLRVGDDQKIFTYFHVKEDGMQLYGFLSKDDLEVFRLLLGVNGVGPKAAVGILTGLSADQLRFAVLSDDVKTICRAPGIGKKTAQKLILELKDKLTLEDAFEKKLSHTEALEVSGPVDDSARSEAVEALVALGYTPTDALKAVKKVDAADATDVEQILRAALKNL